MQRWLFWVVLSLCAVCRVPGAGAEEKPRAMNEMAGTIQGIDQDAQLIRLQTENGFNVTFSYDRETACKGIGVPKDVSELMFKDQVVIRYVGKELLAREIEKRSLQPAVAASSPTPPAN